MNLVTPTAGRDLTTAELVAELQTAIFELRRIAETVNSGPKLHNLVHFTVLAFDMHRLFPKGKSPRTWYRCLKLWSKKGHRGVYLKHCQMTLQKLYTCDQWVIEFFIDLSRLCYPSSGPNHGLASIKKKRASLLSLMKARAENQQMRRMGAMAPSESPDQ